MCFWVSDRNLGVCDMRWLHWHSIILSAKAILASAGSACSASAAVVGGEPARAGTQARDRGSWESDPKCREAITGK